MNLRFLLIIFSCVSYVAHAQPFTELPLPSSGALSASTGAFLDVDGDGDQDLLIAGNEGTERNRQAKLYINDGDGNLSLKENTPFQGVVGGQIAVADIDGDTDLDVFITGQDQRLAPSSKLYINDGLGNFSLRSSNIENVQLSTAAFADVDGDNDPDLAISGFMTGHVRTCRLYFNDGTGQFTQRPCTRVVPVSNGELAFADVDGDNDQDLLVTGNNFVSRSTTLYVNNGTGNFIESTRSTFPQMSYGRLSFADVDGDGDQDLLLAGNASPAIASLYLNDGEGRLREVTDAPLASVGYPKAATFADVDADGDPDIFLASFNDSTNLTNIYLNDGVGHFTLDDSILPVSMRTNSATLGDIDGDRDLDIVLGQAQDTIRRTRLFLNESIVNAVELFPKFLRNEFSVYPNPAPAQRLQLHYDLIHEQSVVMQITDIHGRILHQVSVLPQLQPGTRTLHIPSLPAGLYGIHYKEGNQLYVSKLLIQ